MRQMFDPAKLAESQTLVPRIPGYNVDALHVDAGIACAEA